jgi:hypothetical protein
LTFEDGNAFIFGPERVHKVGNHTVTLEIETFERIKRLNSNVK